MSIVSLIKRHYRSAAVLLGVFAVLFGSLLFVNQALANSDNMLGVLGSVEEFTVMYFPIEV